MTTTPLSTISVDFNGHDGWDVVLADHAAPVTVARLDEACGLARRTARRQVPCRLVIRDAYHRVVSSETLPPHERLARR